LTHGFVSEFHEDEKTPIGGLTGSTRGREIRLWLDDNPDTTKFIIIDDCSDGIKDTQLENFFAQTDYYNGFTTEAYLKARKILDKQENEELRYISNEL
jgi:hypothetical protein